MAKTVSGQKTKSGRAGKSIKGTAAKSREKFKIRIKKP